MAAQRYFMELDEALPVGATPLDDYSGLKLQHIETLQELYEAEFTNITLGTKKYFLNPVGLTALARPEYLYRIHHSMFSSVWDWAGKNCSSLIMETLIF